MKKIGQTNGKTTLVLPELGEEGQVELRVTDIGGTKMNVGIVLSWDQLHAIGRWLEYASHLEDVRSYIRDVEEGYAGVYKDYGPDKLREIEGELVELYEGVMDDSGDWMQMIRNAVETYDWYKKRGE